MYKDEMRIFESNLCSPNEDFGKMNKDEMRIVEALFKGVRTRFGLRIVEKYLENHHFCTHKKDN